MLPVSRETLVLANQSRLFVGVLALAVSSKKARSVASSQLLEEFLAAKSQGAKYVGEQASPRTISTYRNQLVRLEDYAGKPLHELSVDDIEAAIEASHKQGLSPSYRNLMLSAGRGFFDWAIRSEKPVACQFNPFSHIRMNKRVAKEEARGITQEQFEAIIRAIEEIDTEKVRNAKLTGPKAYNLPWVQENGRLPKKVLPVKLMYYGGLRINEAVSLKIANIDACGIVVEGGRGNERYIPLPRRLMSELNEYVRTFSEDSVYVFTPIKTARYKKGTHLHQTRVHEPFNEAVKRAGLPEWITPHALRDSFGFQAMKRTQRLEVAQMLLGFESPERALIYQLEEISDPYLESKSVWD